MFDGDINHCEKGNAGFVSLVFDLTHFKEFTLSYCGGLLEIIKVDHEGATFTLYLQLVQIYLNLGFICSRL